MRQTVHIRRFAALAGLLATLMGSAAMAHTGLFWPIEKTEYDGPVTVYMMATLTAPSSDAVFHTGGPISMWVDYAADHRIVLTGDGTQGTSAWGTIARLSRGGMVDPLDVDTYTKWVLENSTTQVEWEESTYSNTGTSVGGHTAHATTDARAETTGYSNHYFGHSHAFSVVSP